MAEMGQKYPKRPRLPAGKSAYEHMGRIVPIAAIGPNYSITSSAVASRDGGTSRPSAVAVLRLITSRRLDGKVPRFLALEDAIGVGRRSAKIIG
jgi:hypothetical protein